MTLPSKVLALLPAGFKRRAATLLVLLLIGLVLESLSLGLIVPLLTVITDPTALVEHPWFNGIWRAIGSPGPQALIGWILGAVVTAFIVKGGLLLFIMHRQARFSQGLSAALSESLFSRYMTAPYSFHLRENSSKMVRNVIEEINVFNNMMTHILSLQIELSAIIGVTILLLIVAPVGAALTISFLGGTGYLLYLNTRGRILRWGQARQIHDGDRTQQMLQGLGGVKELSLLGRANHVIDRFSEHNSRKFDVQARMQLFSGVPRLWIEVNAIIGFALFMWVMLLQGRPPTTILPAVGVFVAAAFRLMPSLNRVIGSLQALRYARPVIDLLYGELVEGRDQGQGRFEPAANSVAADSEDGNPARRLTTSLTLDSLSFAYGTEPGRAVADVDIEIRSGEFVGFVGESGSGKSTLVDLVIGLLVPTAGRILVDGEDIRDNLRGWQNRIGYVSQEVFLFDGTIAENIAFGLPERLIDYDRVQQAARMAELGSLLSRQREGIRSSVGERGTRISGGERQRIGIARALYDNPDLLVLDEATSALDPETEKSVTSSVLALRGQKTIIAVAHRFSTVASCDRIYRLHEGRVVQVGTPDEVLTSTGPGTSSQE